jgi:hypothetical protein
MRLARVIHSCALSSRQLWSWGAVVLAGWGDLEMFYSQERARWDWTFDFMPPPRVSSQQTAVEAEAWPPPPLQLQWRRVASAFRGCRLYEAEFPTVVPRAVHDALPHESRYDALPPHRLLSVSAVSKTVPLPRGLGSRLGFRRWQRMAAIQTSRDCQQPHCSHARSLTLALACLGLAVRQLTPPPLNAVC